MINLNDNLKPIEEGNAQIIEDVCLPIHQLALLRYEAISDFYTEEPQSIDIRIEKDREYVTFEQILRVRTWVPNKKTHSWCVYSEDRELTERDNNTCGLLIRQVTWDREKDLNKFKNADKETYKKLLESWPTLKIRNTYLEPQLCNEIEKIIRKFDEILQNGIALEERSNISSTPSWKNMELLRLFDWGKVHTTWSPSKENKVIESYILLLEKIFSESLDFATDEAIHQVNLDYSCPPIIWKALVHGNLNSILEK